MYDFVLNHYQNNTKWEKTRDLLHENIKLTKMIIISGQQRMSLVMVATAG